MADSTMFGSLFAPDRVESFVAFKQMSGGQIPPDTSSSYDINSDSGNEAGNEAEPRERGRAENDG
jgi:hypothetical protein